MSEAPTPTFPDGAKVKIKPLNLIGKIAGFAHVGCNGQMRVLSIGRTARACCASTSPRKIWSSSGNEAGLHACSGNPSA